MHRLPFVSKTIDQSTGKPASLWEVAACGDWSKDNELGWQYGQACVQHMTANGNPSLLFQVVKAMGKAGRFGGVECGFMHYIASASIQ